MHEDIIAIKLKREVTHWFWGQLDDSKRLEALKPPSNEMNPSSSLR